MRQVKIPTHCRKSIIFVISCGIFMINILLMSEKSIEELIEKLKEKVKIIIYLKDSEEASLLKKVLVNMDEKLIINYVSKEEALNDFIKSLPAPLHNQFTNSLDRNPLPAYIELSLSNYPPESIKYQISFIRHQIEHGWMKSIEEIVCNEKIVNFMNKLIILKKIIFPTSYIIMSLGLAIVIFILFNMSLVKAQPIIKILKINGSSYSFIRSLCIRSSLMEGFWGVGLGLVGTFLFYKLSLYILGELTLVEFIPYLDFLSNNMILYVIMITLIGVSFLKLMALNIAMNKI